MVKLIHVVMERMSSIFLMILTNIILLELMEFLGKLTSNYTPNIGMLPSESIYGSINFSEHCLHTITNKYWFNGPKEYKKMKNR